MMTAQAPFGMRPIAAALKDRPAIALLSRSIRICDSQSSFSRIDAPYFYCWDNRRFRLPIYANCAMTRRVVRWGAAMSETEKARSEKPEAKPTHDGQLSAPPRKEKSVEPVASRAAHYS